MKNKLLTLKQVLIKYAEQIDIMVEEYSDETNKIHQGILCLGREGNNYVKRS